MVNDISQPDQPIRIDTTTMSKEEVAGLLSAIFAVRVELEKKNLKVTVKRKRPLLKCRPT